jgi:uncharacterized protein DUF4440
VDDDETEDATVLEAINTSLPAWEQRRDPESVRHLEDVISTDLIFRRADKSIVGRAEFLAALTNPSPFVERSTRDLAVVIRGDQALATCVVATRRADGTAGEYRNLRVFLRRDGRWLLAVWFNDDVTSTPLEQL